MDVLLLLGAWLIGLAVILGALSASSMRVVAQYEKGVVFRLGRARSVREPGLAEAAANTAE
ncbi:hypothetical protein JK358_08380 [Nocardia sp. 2]|uniref:Uncharacterized protein n=1 Tax=Nocardia acididurans TaxID=2802282 RepID=A0ABS1M189_9NOCA|nr:hypothetical protein [Nocardia acididurans]MBL1074412.1 hypothetical protein [Nocardia acididurans]